MGQSYGTVFARWSTELNYFVRTRDWNFGVRYRIPVPVTLLNKRKMQLEHEKFGWLKIMFVQCSCLNILNIRTKLPYFLRFVRNLPPKRQAVKATLSLSKRDVFVVPLGFNLDFMILSCWDGTPWSTLGLWIRIQWLCGSGSVLGIRIRIQRQEN
jgi:hypothetical protein